MKKINIGIYISVNQAKKVTKFKLVKKSQQQKPIKKKPMEQPKTAPASPGRRTHTTRRTTQRTAPSPGRRSRRINNIDDPSQDYSQERTEAKIMMRSLRERARLEGKLERVNNRLNRAKRALENKAKKASQRLQQKAPTPETTRGGGSSSSDAERSGLPSWRKPYLEDYTFKSPVVHSLLSNGMSPEHRFVTEKMYDQQAVQPGNKDAAELKRLSVILDGRNGMIKSDFSKYAEDKIIFDRMMAPRKMEKR